MLQCEKWNLAIILFQPISISPREKPREQGCRQLAQHKSINKSNPGQNSRLSMHSVMVVRITMFLRSHSYKVVSFFLFPFLLRARISGYKMRKLQMLATADPENTEKIFKSNQGHTKRTFKDQKHRKEKTSNTQASFVLSLLLQCTILRSPSVITLRHQISRQTSWNNCL